MFPTIAEYNQAIKSKGGNAFKTLSNLTFIPSRTVPVKIYSYGSGSYAVVFKAKDHFNEFAIRCFISAEQENIDRYRKIDSYLKNLNASWITKIELLEDEINVGYQHYPVIKMDWVEGQLLNNFITQIIDNNNALTELQKEVVSLSISLENLKIGHGDIQCGNIIVAKSGDGKNIIKLIDYDGMYIPSFSNKINLERGRTEFQHPNRSQIQYNEKIDRFSFWVILCAIEALKFDKSLWFEVMRGGFNTLDNLLFLGDDFKYFNNSKLVKRLYLLNISSLNFYLDKLNKFCNSSPEIVEFPSLFDYANYEHPIESSQEFSTKNSNTEIQIITNPNGAAVLTSTFQRIGTTPLKIDKQKYLGKSLIITYGTQIKQLEILELTAVIDLTFSELKHQENVTSNLPIASPILTTPPNTPPESDNSGWIAFGVIIALIILAIAIIANINQKNVSAYNPNYNSPQPTINTDTAVDIIDSNVSVKIPAIEDTPIVRADTVSTEQVVSDEINYSQNLKDDYNLTPQEVLKIFFEALANKDCNLAWNKTYNTYWENKGQNWFCSSEAFGGIYKVIINSNYPIFQSSNEAVIQIDYYAEDIYYGNQCFEQKITLKKFLSNYQTGWMITKMQNTKKPYSCELTNE